MISLASLVVEVKTTEIEPVTKILKATSSLLQQIEINDYKDSLGHDIKNNKAYCELIKAIERVIDMEEEREPVYDPDTNELLGYVDKDGKIYNS